MSDAVTVSAVIGLACDDVTIFSVIGIAAAAGVIGACMKGPTTVRIGCLLSMAAVCEGAVYFGFEALFCSRQSPEAYFGATLVVVGILAYVVLLAIGRLHVLATSLQQDVRDTLLILRYKPGDDAGRKNDGNGAGQPT